MKLRNVSLNVSFNGKLTEVSFGDFTLYFSYQTLVAFIAPKIELVCQQNVWGNTTGKHLNDIQPDKNARVDGPEFERLAAVYLPTY